jgi:hypothetical protein
MVRRRRPSLEQLLGRFCRFGPSILFAVGPQNAEAALDGFNIKTGAGRRAAGNGLERIALGIRFDGVNFGLH